MHDIMMCPKQPKTTLSDRTIHQGIAEELFQKLPFQKSSGESARFQTIAPTCSRHAPMAAPTSFAPGVARDARERGSWTEANGRDGSVRSVPKEDWRLQDAGFAVLVGFFFACDVPYLRSCSTIISFTWYGKQQPGKLLLVRCMSPPERPGNSPLYVKIMSDHRSDWSALNAHT